VVVARFSRAKALCAVATSRLMRADLYGAQPTSPVRRLVLVAMGAKDDDRQAIAPSRLSTEDHKFVPGFSR
jgi:hypothetical protein